ncbi:antitermination protein N [Pectobacterium brasiliense]|uniref:antitermination protein N n=1 Tax=Pectobacterium brasiliense TaxID=180957 RepID=UPI00057EF22F|nr:antitermination protein N [Pectobacterium brasiliense]KHS87100.1 antitermination protein [Pectobacterium brasiliense]
MNAQERRRESRAAKQAEWKAANPLLVGISSTKGKQALRPTLSLSRKAMNRVEKAINPIDLSALAEYHQQIESNLAKIERKNHSVWYKDVNPLGNKIHAVQKQRGKSTPLI